MGAEPKVMLWEIPADGGGGVCRWSSRGCPVEALTFYEEDNGVCFSTEAVKRALVCLGLRARCLAPTWCCS
ncbi:hypothetical protein E2562_039321 [Oryza meyeriana var. granulata]|uniref:Uncharacterized protein n=1 Tax=Oryza meyeriana var. granulata TaxID=110450 RepID=A0A6G1E9G1_9ORYZ|nr:hypothetical protein E2562_039321 [Oryza meyeriana var. granulata]